MSQRRPVLHAVLILGLVLGLSPTRGWSQDADPAAKVALTASAIHIMVGTVNNFTSMQVRIQAPNGNLVLNARSTGEAVSWAPSATTEDGYYRYEADVFSQNPAAATAAASDKDEEAGVTRQQVSGPFVVKEGLIVVPAEEEATPDKSQSRLEMEPWWQPVLTGISDFLVPSAHAVDLTAESSFPEIFFDDTQDEDCVSTADWQIRVEGGVNNADTANSFILFTRNEVVPCGTLIPIMTFNNNGTNGNTTSSVNSIVVPANGDMGLANNSLFIARSTGRVGIGTTTPSQPLQVFGFADFGAAAGGNQDLDVISTNPEIGLVDTTDSSQFGIEYDSGLLAFEAPGIGGDGEIDVMTIHRNAPANSLTINDVGRVGIGTLTPAGRFQVVDNVDGGSFLWALNNSNTLNAVAVLRAEAAGGNVLNFQAHAPARTLARFGQALGGWAELLAVGSNGLAIGSALNVPVIIGTNNLERIRVTSTGVTVFGTFTNSSSRELKEDIRPLTTSEAMAGLAGLEPMKFRYKEQTEENLGFIAEDVPDLVAVEGRKSIAPMDVIALLTKVAKEQQQTITELQRTVVTQRAQFEQSLSLVHARMEAMEHQQTAQRQQARHGE
jgi:Chaperone of endosialidase